MTNKCILFNESWKNATASNIAQQTMQREVMRTTFGIIAFLSVFGNFLLCVVMVRKRSMLRKTYNKLIFNLAVADTLTGIFIVATPDYLFDRRSFPFPEGLAGEIYCRLIGSTYILFIFGKASTLTIMFLAIDRWYSIIKPIVYKTTFSKRRLYFYIALIWIISCITQLNELFITMVEDGLCTFKTPFYGIELERILILTHVTLTFYIPSIITWCSFAHIMLRMRRAAFRQSLNNVKATERLLRMCALAAFFLSICWLPTETFFILFKFKVYQLPFTVSLVLGVLAMFNSCLNPWIYCLSNREYRREFTKLFCCFRTNMTGISALLTRVSSLRNSYSFSNNIALSNLNLTTQNNEASSMARQRNSIFDQLTSSTDATLKRFSFQEASFDGLANNAINNHSL